MIVKARTIIKLLRGRFGGGIGAILMLIETHTTQPLLRIFTENFQLKFMCIVYSDYSPGYSLSRPHHLTPRDDDA